MENEDLISQFQAITNENADRSRFYLESANWDLNVALGSFYDNSDGPMVNAVAPQIPARADTDSDPEFEDAEETLAREKDMRVSGNRFRSLADYQPESKADDSEEEGQEFYAGGSEHSGEVILGPGKKKSGEDIVKKMFKDAKKHGAVPVEAAGPSSGRRNAPNYFSGGGYKLGETNNDHHFIPGAPKSQEEKQLDVVLKLWKDGYTIDDGPLRSYHDEESKQFLQAIAKGEIPQELLKLAKGGKVNLDMEDHKTEEYKPEKKKMTPFTGEGRTLGGITPAVVSNTASSKPVQTSSVDAPVNIDSNSPVTTVRIQFGDGSKVTQKFNHSHTLAQVYSFVRNSGPSNNRNFVLMTTFPNKELKEDSTTLKDGNLLNAVVVQRFK